MELSKQAQRHKDLTDKLIALVESRRESLPKNLAARFAPHLAAGETMPDFALVVQLYVRELAAKQSDESAAVLAAAKEAGDDPAVINAQEEARQALYSEMTLLRSEVETGHGTAGVAALGMRGTTPTRAQDLETYATSVLQSLRDEKISLGAPRSKRMSFEREAAANSIAPLVEALAAANKEFNKEAAELKVAQEARKSAIDAWKEGAPSLGAALRALFVLSGDAKGAERIVLNPYRKGKEEEIEIADEAPTTP